MGPSDRFEELSSTIQQRVQYCNTALNQSYTGDRQPTKPSVIKNCQVIRMLTAYAVTTRRTLARGWRVFVRRQAALPGRGIAASFRFMRVGDMDAATATQRSASAACAIVGLGSTRLSLAVRVGW
jgi:hypothetical protein